MCYRQNMGVPQIHMLEPNPHGVMVLGGGAFQRSLGHEGGALMDGICIFIKEAPESSLTPSAM